MTNKEIREKLETQYWDKIVFKQDSRDGMIHKGDVYVDKGYFYTHGMTPDALCDKVLSIFPDAKIIDSGNHWAAWPARSYMFVIFRLDRTKKVKHDDECDCVTCRARVEKGGLDYDPSNDDEEFEEHERQAMRDTGIDKEAK